MSLFRRKRKTVTIHLNARLLPLDRGELFEDPLETHLSEGSFRAELGDAGTLLSAEGEPTSCDVELEVPRDADVQALAGVITEFLDSLGAPRGSTVVDDDGTVLASFGVTEGLALYLNGTDLPPEVYAASDTNDIVAEVNAALGDEGRMLSYWHGPDDTALYLYGSSEGAMRARLADLLATRADMQLSRLETIT